MMMIAGLDIQGNRGCDTGYHEHCLTTLAPCMAIHPPGRIPKNLTT